MTANPKKFDLRKEIIALITENEELEGTYNNLYSFALRCRDAALEEAAKLVEENDEAVNLRTAQRFIQPKTTNNLNGNSYAQGIRSLKTTREEGK